MIRKSISKGIIIISVFMLGLTWVQAEEKDIVAQIGTRVITKIEFERMLKRRGGEVSIDKKMEISLLNNLAQTIALGDLAREKGLDKRKDVQEMMELTIDNLLANVLVKEEVVDKVTVSDTDAKKNYEDHLALYKTPAKARVRHILIKAEKSASTDVKKKARERTEEVLKKIKAGEDFGKLAVEYSDDPMSQAKGGDLGFVEKGQIVKMFDEAAFKLNPGEVSDIIESSYGFHIIRMEEKKEEVIQPFESVKDKVTAKLREEIKTEKIKEFLTRVMKDSDIKIFAEVLEGTKK
jgi:parvulin-like peptidyl-prolyl isomerase